MDIEKLDKFIDRVVSELCIFEQKNPLVSSDLKDMGALADMLKDLIEAKVKFQNGGGMDEYSLRNMPHMSYMNSSEHPYGGDYSMNQRRSPVTGKYMSSSYDRDYSGHSFKDRMVAQLEPLMDSAGSDYEKNLLLEEIRSIRNR